MANGEDDLDFEGMTDEEFMNAAFSAEAESDAQNMEPEPEEPRGGLLEDRIDAAPLPLDQGEGEDTVESGEEKGEGEEAEDEGEPSPSAEDASKTEDDHTTPHQTEEGKEGEEAPAAEAEAEGESESTEEKDPEGTKEGEEPDYKSLYDQLMKPFKANGKEFQPASPEEATRLMQMGANYTQKMQALKPNLKMMRMLENHGLLDEQKLSYLIDLDKKDPKAIQKLLHDGKIDPLEVDTSEEPAYRPGNHSVSDQEMAFHDVIQDVGSSDDGKKTINHVNQTWDQASKQAIFAEPQLLAIINEQRSNGVYDTISAEIDRQRMLGELQNVPFIQAYKEVGDRLHRDGKLGPASGSTTQEVQNPAPAAKPRQILETRTAQPRKQMSNGDKAKAASASPKTPQSRKPSFDPFSMSDEEIMAIPAPHTL